MDIIQMPGGWGWAPGYALKPSVISPEAIVAYLPTITGLETLGRMKRAEAVREALSGLEGQVTPRQIHEKYGLPLGTAWDIAKGLVRGSGRPKRIRE